MCKLLIFLCLISTISQVLTYDTCRKKVIPTPGSTCGPQQTIYNEGECLCCYYDIKNIPTIGIGFKLRRTDAPTVMARYGLNISKVLQDCVDKTTLNCLKDANAKEIFNAYIYPEFERCVDSYSPGLPTIRRAAIIDVAFAGCATLNKFVNMKAALKKRDWKTAGKELKNSKRCRDPHQKNRCNSDYKCLVDDDICRKKVITTPGSTCGPQQTIYNEKECLCCYYDTKDIPTIGIGFNLRRTDAPTVMARYGLNISKVLQDCVDKTTLNCLTDANAKEIFNAYIYPECERCVDSYSPGLPTVKRAALIDVAFAGCATLNKFVNMKAALMKRDWKTAGKELKNSKWCKDVRQNRCNSDYKCLVESVCTGQSCGYYVPCSLNPLCYCFKTSYGAGFCATNQRCGDLPDCSSCPLTTSVCVIDSCCYRPVCIPLSAGQACTNPPEWQKVRFQTFSQKGNRKMRIANDAQ